VKAYELARRKDFPAIRIGRRIVIPKAAFERWLEQAALESNPMAARQANNGGRPEQRNAVLPHSITAGGWKSGSSRNSDKTS